MRKFLPAAILMLATLFPAGISAAEREPADLLIVRAHLLTMNERREVIRDGVVAIRGERILAVGEASLAARFNARRTLDARGALVLPGMVNTHTHASMTVFRGLGDDVPDRLRRFIFPLEQHFVGVDLGRCDLTDHLRGIGVAARRAFVGERVDLPEQLAIDGGAERDVRTGGD